MKKSLRKWFVLLSSLLICGLLAACGTASNEKSPSVASNTTPHISAQPTPTATPIVVGLGKDYAFVRNNQVWIALNGAALVQATHFTQVITTTNVFWSQPLWFDNDHFLVFTLNVIDSGIGGAGCAYQIRYMRGHELFVLNTGTMQLTPLKAPGEHSSAPGAINGSWSADSLFREDDTHLLAWDISGDYASPSNASTNTGGLYRYDFTTQALARVISAASVPGADEAPLMHPMRYSHEQLFYETTTSVDNNGTFDYAIYSHSLTNPTQPSVKILEVGRASFCPMNPTPGMSTFDEPGWDVSPDDTYLVAQTFMGNDLVHQSSQVQLIKLPDGTSTPIFQQVAPQVFTQDVGLVWGPDSQSLLLSSGNPASTSNQEVFDTINITNPTALQSYTVSPSIGYGYMALWHASSTAFALMQNGPNRNDNGQVYLFKEGQPQGELLFANADNFAWGANQ